jgi:hypothetical protein
VDAWLRPSRLRRLRTCANWNSCPRFDESHMLSASWLITGCSRWEYTIRLPAPNAAIARTTADDALAGFRRDDAHYGYGPVCAVLSQRFGATFEFTTTGGNCTALVATLEGGYRVLITDGGDMVGSLTPLSQRDGSDGFAIGVYFLDADGCWGGDATRLGG